MPNVSALELNRGFKGNVRPNLVIFNCAAPSNNVLLFMPRLND